MSVEGHTHNYANKSHTHTTSQITGLRSYIEGVIDDYGGGGGTKTYTANVTISKSTANNTVLWSQNVGTGASSISRQIGSGTSRVIYANGSFTLQSENIDLYNTGSAITSSDCRFNYSYSGGVLKITVTNVNIRQGGNSFNKTVIFTVTK